MRRLITIGLCLLASPSWAVIAHVNSCSNFDFGSTLHATLSCTLPATTAGNLLIITCSWGTNRQTPTGSDGGDTFTQPANTLLWDASHNQAIDVVYAENIAAGRTTPTCNFSPSSNFTAISAHEYSGLATSSSIDISTSNVKGASAATSNNIFTASMTTTTNGDLVFGVWEDVSTGSGDTCTAGTTSLAYTERVDICSGSGLSDGDAVQTTAGPTTFSVTETPTGRSYNVSAIALKASGGAAPTPTTDTLPLMGL